MATQIHRHLLKDSKQPEVNYNSYQERTLCVVIGGTFILVSITILISSLFKWCRTQNNINDHRSTNTSAAVLQQQQEPAQCYNVSMLSAIPVIIYGLPSSSSQSSSSFAYVDNVCSICLAEFEDGENLRVLPCKHVFHKVCIDLWIPSRSLHCPICRDRTIRRDVEPDQRTVCNNPSAALVLNFAFGPHILSHL